MPKKHIYLTEKQIETIKNRLLTENRESKNMSKARNLLYQQGYSQEEAQKTIEAIRNDIPSARLADCKFLPGVTRMYLNRELSDGNTIMKLNKTLKYVASDAHVNEYDNNLNGLSVNELVQRFAGVQQQDADASRSESYSKQYTRNSDYTIVRIPDAKTAAKYGRYTSWCVTHDKNMYNSYTADGTGLFYFCLRNGFENERPIASEGCPLDSYGLSMIAVSITMDGELNTCTCRWNHDNDGNDNIMDKNQLEELLGVNFYEVFKPYTREELHAKGIILFDEVPDLLAQGKKPEDIFENIGDFHDGFAEVELNNKYNFINTNGELVSPNQWFDNVSGFFNGFAGVRLNNKWNFINTNGELVWKKPVNEWFDNVGKFVNGFAEVRLNDEWYYLRSDGVLCDIDTKEPVQDMNESKQPKKRIFFTENQVSEIQQKLQKAREDTDKHPTEKQKQAGNYKLGRVRVLGYDIAIENPRGAIRSGEDKHGNKWQVKMKNDYGYFTHTLGYDGDAVDVFLGDNFDTYSIFAVDQKIDGKFDETKIMLGFKNEQDAKDAYISNYNPGWNGFWKITEVPHTVFQKWLYDGYQQKKPFFQYAEIKKEKLNENGEPILIKESLEDCFEEHDTYSTVNQFVKDMKNGRQVQNWRPLINPAMYQRALQVFTKQGNLDGFPEKYVYQWMGIVMRNTVQLNTNSEIAGHTNGMDYDAFDDSCLNEYIHERLGFTVMSWGSDVTLEITPQYLIQQLQNERLSPAEKEYLDTFIQNQPQMNEDAVHQSGENKGQMAMFMSQPELDYYDNEKALRTKVNNLQGLIDIYNEHNTDQENRVTYEISNDIISINENGQLVLKMSILRLLGMTGIYDWMQMPDGSDAWSDYGLRPLFEVIQKYDDRFTSPEETLVIINKALDVSHPRGDMASIFIEGGSKTLTQISNTGYVNENIDVAGELKKMLSETICNEINISVGNKLRYLQEWQIEDIQKNAHNGVIKLYHNTSGINLGDILSTGELDTHQKHTEGHGHMLFFTVNPTAWEHECKISIEVPVEEFENINFRFVNDDSVVTENNIPIDKYNFKIEKVRYLDYDRIVEILTGDDMNMKEYLLLKYFQEYDYMWWIKEWFLHKLGYQDECDIL